MSPFGSRLLLRSLPLFSVRSRLPMSFHLFPICFRSQAALNVVPPFSIRSWFSCHVPEPALVTTAAPGSLIMALGSFGGSWSLPCGPFTLGIAILSLVLGLAMGFSYASFPLHILLTPAPMQCSQKSCLVLHSGCLLGPLSCISS